MRAARRLGAASKCSESCSFTLFLKNETAVRGAILLEQQRYYTRPFFRQVNRFLEIFSLHFQAECADVNICRNAISVDRARNVCSRAKAQRREECLKDNLGVFAPSREK